MNTAARITARPKTEDGQRLLLYGIDWDTYEKFLDAVGDRPIRLTYDGENMEIAVPGWSHESWKRCIDHLILVLGLELGFEYRGGGSTTLRRAEVHCGIEPDECYYIKNEPAVRGIEVLDLTRLPPPDVALEVDITRSSIDRMAIYAALRVPEVWRFDGQEMFIYHLRRGEYVPATESLAIPVLTLAHIHEFIDETISLGETALHRVTCKWVKKNIVPLWRKMEGRTRQQKNRPPK